MFEIIKNILMGVLILFLILLMFGSVLMSILFALVQMDYFKDDIQ